VHINCLKHCAKHCIRGGIIARRITLAVVSLMAMELGSNAARAWQGMVPGDNPTPKLHVTGRFLQDSNGKNVTLYGYMQPAASWFNGEGHNYADPKDFTDPAKVAPALNYYNAVANIMSDPRPRYGQNHGWYCSYVRFIGDGSAPENFGPGWDAEGKLARPEQFKAWLDNVVVPYVNHCRTRGLYVILVGNPSEAFPPGKDGKPDHGHNMTQQYQQNLITFWTAVASHPGLKSADNVHFEICNEPVAIESSFGKGDWGMGNDAYDQAITKFMQPVADAIRAQGADNIIWIPGLGWQGQYAGFAKYPVNGGNIGYAAHIYPAYGGSHDNATKVRNLWNTNYKPAADKAPMIITELAWSPNSGQGYQGLFNASTAGFGNAVRTMFDQQGNVSFQVGMVGDLFDNLKAGLANTTLGSPQGTQAAFQWFPSYKEAAPIAPVGPAAGIYEISPSEDLNLTMQVSGNADANANGNVKADANGTRLGLSRWNGAANQKFCLHPLGNNTYWLEPQNAPGKCVAVDVANASLKDDAAVQLDTYGGALGQQWLVISLGDGNYRLAPVLNPTQTLDLPGGTIYANKAKSGDVQLPAPGLPAPPDPSGKASPTLNAALNLQTYTWWGAPGQKWRLTPR